MRAPEEADSIASGLIEARLAACVQQAPIHSTYRWEGKAVKDEELLLLIKTRTDLYHQIEIWITAHHSYDTPEIILLPVIDGLDWGDDETAEKSICP